VVIIEIHRVQNSSGDSKKNKEEFQGNKNKQLQVRVLCFSIIFAAGKTTNGAEINKEQNSRTGYWKYQWKRLTPFTTGD